MSISSSLEGVAPAAIVLFECRTPLYLFDSFVDFVCLLLAAVCSGSGQSAELVGIGTPFQGSLPLFLRFRLVVMAPVLSEPPRLFLLAGMSAASGCPRLHMRLLMKQ